MGKHIKPFEPVRMGKQVVNVVTIASSFLRTGLFVSRNCSAIIFKGKEEKNVSESVY